MKNPKTAFVILIVAAVILTGAVILFKSGGLGAKTLWSLSNGGKWLMPLVVTAAIIDSINPCAFSILILTIAFLFSIGQMRSSILKIGSFYIIGIFAAYVLIGLGILQALHLFNTPHFMAKVGALLLIALGLINIINEFFPPFPIKLRIPRAAHQKMAELMNKASLPTAFFLGGLVGLCEFPCTGGPYLLVLGLLHDSQTYLRGLGYLAIYNLIFVLPLIVILLLSSSQVFLEKVREWKKRETGRMRLWGGIATIVLGLLIFAV